MWETFKRLALGIALISAASALLLCSDLGSRKTAGTPKPQPQRMVHLALLQHASQAVLDQGREGMIAGLAEQGWMSGKNLQIHLYNAEGDNTVSQAIAREMVNGGNDFLMTISTPSLQAVANANKTAMIPHVFGLVTSPAAAGVGISDNDPLKHPPWMAGFGTMQPIGQAFDIARDMNPSLKNVGVVWNASEANAEAQLKQARTICAGLGINLMEVTVDNSAGVGEAAAALIARGADAIWVPGDVTVMTAIDSVIGAAKKGRIPVFTVIPPNVKHGALFDIGADYHEVGRLAGVLAGTILNGRKPASVPIENVMPEILTLNLQTAADLKDKWTVSDMLIKRARTVINPDGSEHSQAAPTPSQSVATASTETKKWKIAVIVYNETPPTEETLAGMDEQWKKSKLVAGKDYEIQIRSSQGDIAAISGILDAAKTEGADLIVPLSTPTLQNTLHKIRDIPIVFSLVANPIAAGAGTSYTDHLPNVTGVAVLGPVNEMLDMLEKYFPTYKHLGTLFCPAETNSLDLKDFFAKLCKERGFTLDAVAANSPGEMADAAMSLMARPIDAVVQISDNLSSAGFTAIAKAARQTHKPLISMNSTTVPMGAPVSMGRDYHHAGEVTVELIERVMAGENPANMPFILPPNVVLTVSPANAEAVGMTIPEELMKKAKVAP